MPDELKLRNSEIDWLGVAAAGNVYRHEYEVVDDALLWHTIHHSLAAQREAAVAELKRPSE